MRLEGALMSCDNSRAQQEEEMYPLLSQQGPIKVSLFSLALPLPLPIYKCSPSLSIWGLACGSSQLQTPNCISLSVLNEPFFAGAIFGNFT